MGGVTAPVPATAMVVQNDDQTFLGNGVDDGVEDVERVIAHERWICGKHRGIDDRVLLVELERPGDANRIEPELLDDVRDRVNVVVVEPKRHEVRRLRAVSVHSCELEAMAVRVHDPR